MNPNVASEATVVVHVEDVNEPPIFLRSHYSVTVSEGVGPGEVLYSGVEAFDGDEVKLFTVHKEHFFILLVL